MAQFTFFGETIRYIWKLGMDEVMDTSKSIDVSPKKKKRNNGWKGKWDQQNERSTICTMTDKTKSSTIHPNFGLNSLTQWKFVKHGEDGYASEDMVNGKGYLQQE